MGKSPLRIIVYSSLKEGNDIFDNQSLLSSKLNDSLRLRKLKYYLVRKRGSAVVYKINWVLMRIIIPLEDKQIVALQREMMPQIQHVLTPKILGHRRTLLLTS